MVEITCVSSFRDLWQTYKTIIKRWFQDNKNISSSYSRNNTHCHKQTQQVSVQDDNATDKIDSLRLDGDFMSDNDNDIGIENDGQMNTRGCCIYRRRSIDGSFPSMKSSNANKKNTDHAASKSHDFSSIPSSWNHSGNIGMHPHLRSRYASRRINTPIMYSNSSGMLKPPPIEKKLECTLEELCYGCKKKVLITRDVLTDTGGIIQEEELLTINVQPGWKKGTTITFVGKGNERPGAFREDIIFFISEKRHQLFRREGDDLELGIEIPLLKALTACKILVPLLGGEEMSLTLDDIIHPGYEKIIPGQGMPISKEPEKRGKLRITFQVEFPKQLTDDQRSEIVRILKDPS